MGFVVKRGENYSARLAIPKALRPILGQNEFKKSLGTTSKKEAELLAAPLVLRWKKFIEEARVDGAKAKAKALHRALSDTKASDLIDEDGAMEVVRGVQTLTDCICQNSVAFSLIESERREHPCAH